jgi:hypothetical protein
MCKFVPIQQIVILEGVAEPTGNPLQVKEITKDVSLKVFEKDFLTFTSLKHIKKFQCALAAWQSGNRISLKNKKPGFEFCEGVRFLREHNIAFVKFG